MNRGGPKKRTTVFDASPVPVRKRPIGDDGRGRRGGGGGGGPARGCQARAPPPRPDPEAIEIGKGPRSQSFFSPPFQRGRGSSGTAKPRRQSPPASKTGGPRREGMFVHGAPSWSQRCSTPQTFFERRGRPPFSPPQGRGKGVVARREGGSREGQEREGATLGLTGVNHLHRRSSSLRPPSARPRPGGRPNGTERREGRRKEDFGSPCSFLPGDPGGPNRQKKKPEKLRATRKRRPRPCVPSLFLLSSLGSFP